MLGLASILHQMQCRASSSKSPNVSFNLLERKMSINCKLTVSVNFLDHLKTAKIFRWDQQKELPMVN